MTEEENLYYTTVRELKAAQRNNKDLERRNNELTAELDKAKQSTSESMNLSKSHVCRIQQLENELSQVKHKNRSESQAFEKDRTVWKERESELMDQLKALHETVSVLAAQEASREKNEESLYYTTARELKAAQRNNKDLERRNNELTAELDKSKQSTSESMNISKSHVRRIQQLENELSQVKHMNRSLMEENEAFQLLLHENPNMQRNDSRKFTDTIEKVTNGPSKDESPQEDDLKNSDELDREFILSNSLLGERVHKESDHTVIEKVQEEIKSLKDENKSMRIYIEKVLNRILEAQGFEELLSSEWKKPSLSSPATPTAGSFNNNQEENKSKKIERHKTFSGWHFRSTSPPQSSFKNDKIMTEEPEQITPLTRKSHEDAPKRAQRNSTSAKNANKRFSLFNWVGAKEEEKKDPYMRPMILVQEKERKE